MSYRRLLGDELFQEFLDEIKGRLQEQTTLTKTESDTVKLFRAQGAVEALESLLAYPEEQILIEEREAEENAASSREDEEE